MPEVGGDKIENVLYRIKLGLLQLCKPLGVVLWVVHTGTNNLRVRTGKIQATSAGAATVFDGGTGNLGRCYLSEKKYQRRAH